jgi:hypothetical protein
MSKSKKQTAIEKAVKLCKEKSTECLISSFEMTIDQHSLEFSIARGFIMDELESRDAKAFELWLDSCQDSPRAFYLALLEQEANEDLAWQMKVYTRD